LLSAFLVALREGVEAALVVGIVLVYLVRTGRAQLARYVWAGVGLAVAASLVGAVALERWQVSQDGFEGLLLLLASLFVVSMVVWMNRVARRLRGQIEQRVESYAGRAAGWGLFLFVFLMVVREGAETALILRAVQLSSEGLSTAIGTLLGLAAAVTVGLLFFKGTLRVSLGRFFAVTSAILVLVAFQLALTGLHELSESRWLPSSKGEMAVIGPIVRNELFFFVFVFGAAALLVLREWMTLAPASAVGAPAANPAEVRRARWDARRQRRWTLAAAVVFLGVVLALTADFIYARASSAAPDAQPIDAVNGLVRIPVADVGDGNLHLFTVRSGAQSFRFLIIRKPSGWGVALDACRICGAAGYRQDGRNVICRHCDSAIYIPTIGEQGGCNPIGVPSRVEGGDIVVDFSAFARGAAEIPR
jgi:high-affinity iron transporter